MDAHQEQFEKDFEAALKEKRENAEKAPPINNHNEQILKKANSNGVVPLASKDDLSQSVIKAKRSFVEFLEGRLKSGWVKCWLRVFFFFILFCFIWFIVVSLYNILYSDAPKKIYIEIWKSSVEFLKLIFAIIGAVFVLIKIFINGKI